MDWKELFTPEQFQQLKCNHAHNAEWRGTRKEADHAPVCRVYLPWMDFYWLLSEVDDEGMAFGLCVLFEPEIGYVYLPEILEVKGPAGEFARVDPEFEGDKPLSEHADEVRRLFYG